MFEGQEGEGTKKEREMEAERLRGKTIKGKGRKNEETSGQNRSLNHQFSNFGQEATS